MREHGAFWPAGGAGGVEDEVRVREASLVLFRHRLARAPREHRLVILAERDGPFERPVGGKRRHEIELLRRHEQDPRAGVVQLVVQLACCEPPVQRHEHRSDARGREEHLHELAAVHAACRDAVVAPDTERVQRLCEPGHALVELGIRETLVVLDQRFARAIEERALGQPRGDAVPRDRLGVAQAVPQLGHARPQRMAVADHEYPVPAARSTTRSPCLSLPCSRARCSPTIGSMADMCP